MNQLSTNFGTMKCCLSDFHVFSVSEKSSEKFSFAHAQPKTFFNFTLAYKPTMKKSLDLVLLDKSLDVETTNKATINYVTINSIVDTTINETSHDDYSNIPTTGAKTKKGDIIFIQHRPVKVTKLFHFKPGKHGSAKVRIEGRDIFTDKKYMETTSVSHLLYRPRVGTILYTLTDMDMEDCSLSLMDEQGGMNYSFDLPSENDSSASESDLGEKIKAAFEKMNDNDTQVIIVVTKCKKNEHDEEAAEIITSYKVEAYDDA